MALRAACFVCAVHCVCVCVCARRRGSQGKAQTQKHVNYLEAEALVRELMARELAKQGSTEKPSLGSTRGLKGPAKAAAKAAAAQLAAEQVRDERTRYRYALCTT